MNNNVRLYMTPRPKSTKKHQCGVDVVVHQMWSRLKKFGVDLTEDVRAPVDVVATHINSHGHARVPDVLHCHGLYPTGELETPKWMWEVNKTVIEAVRQAERVTVPSPWVQQLFARDMGFLPTIVPHGIELSEWPMRKRPETRFQNRLRILWNKNRSTPVCDVSPVDDLADILDDDMTLFTTVGKDTRNCRVVGTMSRERMKELIYETDVYYASTRETFGIGTLEALAAGCPVLGWNWGATPDIIEHDVDGFLVEPGDIQGTYEGLQHIWKNFERMSLAARKKAAQFSWDAAVEQYAEVYRSIVAQRESPQRDHVTVVVPCYNYEKYVRDTIESVKALDYENFDCIIVNDGSTDSSAQIIEQTIKGDDRFQLINKDNGGVASARNLGAYRASGEYVAFLDADDVIYPGFIQDLLPPLRQDRSAAISYGGLGIITPDGKRTRGAGDWPGPYSAEKQFAKKNRIPSCCLFRRDIFLRTGGIRQRFAPTEDAELWTRFPLLGYKGIQATTEAVYDYRLHNESASMAVRGGKEPDWTSWLGPLNGAKMPFASLSQPASGISHPVINYDKPEISFITPVGPGHEADLVDALDSVAAQSYDRWEHVVVDDTGGDLENWGDIPYKIRYPWVVWVKNEKRGNVSAARNLGVRKSSGRNICFLDADDFLYRDYSR